MKEEKICCREFKNSSGLSILELLDHIAANKAIRRMNTSWKALIGKLSNRITNA